MQLHLHKRNCQPVTAQCQYLPKNKRRCSGNMSEKNVQIVTTIVFSVLVQTLKLARLIPVHLQCHVQHISGVTCWVLGTMVVQMKNQTVDNKVLIYQNIQCINILAQAPEYIHVMFVCMTMSRSKIIYNLFYNC